DAQLRGGGQPDPPSGEPAGQRGGGEPPGELHERRLLRTAGTPRDRERAATARSDAARAERVRALAQRRAVQRQLRGRGFAPAHPHAHRRRRGPAVGKGSLDRARVALARRRGRRLPEHRGPHLCGEGRRRPRLARRVGAHQPGGRGRVRGGTLEIVPGLTTTLAARYDWIRVPLEDLVDPAQNGLNIYRRLSPRVGLAWSGWHGHELFASLSRGFRAPAVVEIGCADPAAACPLPFALGPDPALRPVVATTSELGWRYHA